MYFFRFWLAKTNRSHTDTLFHTVSFTWSGNTNQVGKYTGNRNNQLYLWRILLRDESDSSSGKSADLHVQPSISKGVWQAPITSWGWTYPGPKAQMTHVHMWISTRPLLVAISQWQLVWSFASIPWFCLLLIDTYLQKVPQWNKRIFADTSYLQSAAVLQYESCWKYFFQIIHNSICNVEFFLGQVIGNIEGEEQSSIHAAFVLSRIDHKVVQATNYRTWPPFPKSAKLSTSTWESKKPD